MLKAKHVAYKITTSCFRCFFDGVCYQFSNVYQSIMQILLSKNLPTSHQSFPRKRFFSALDKFLLPVIQPQRVDEVSR